MNKLFKYIVLFLICLVAASKTSAQEEFKIGFEPRDRYSQQIIPAIISVRALDSETELAGQMINEQYVMRVQADVQYQVFVAMQDYTTYKEVVKFERKGSPNTPQAHIIFMEPLTPPKTLGPKSVINASDPILTILDKKTRSVITQAIVTLKTTSGQSVSIIRTPQGTWSAKIQEFESYIVEVKAPGYENFKDLIRYKAGEPFEIGLIRSLKQPIEFQAVDAQTNRPVGARFKLTDNIRETFTGVATINNDIFGAEVAIQPDAYFLTVSATGYRSYQITINVNSEATQAMRQVIKLIKSEATLKLKVVDSQTAQAVSGTKFKITEQGTNKVIYDAKDLSGDLTLTINPDRKYIIEAENDGYSAYRQVYENKSFNPESSFAVKLTKKLDSYMMLSARDASTNQILPASFKIISSQNEQDFDFRTTQASPMGKLTLTEPAVYKIETTVPGYRVHKGEINAVEMSFGKVFKYEAIIFSENSKIAESPKPKVEEKPKPIKVEPTVAKVETPKVTEKPKVAEPVVAKVETPKVTEKPKVAEPVVAKVETPKVTEKPKVVEPVVAKVETPKVTEKPKEVAKPAKTEPEFVRIETAKIIETPKNEAVKPAPVIVKTETPKPTPTIAKVETPKPKVEETPKEIVAVMPSSVPTSKIFTFRIVDGQTKKAVLPKRFAVRSKKMPQLISSKFANGVYSTELQFNDSYLIEIEADGYTKIQTSIDAGAMSKQELFEKDFSLMPLPKKAPAKVAVVTKTKINDKAFDNYKLGQTLTFEDNVYFDQGEYILRDEAQPQLDKLAAIMTKNPKLKIEIAGHTDNVGDPKQNMTLSEFRAKVIANHLINKGVVEEQITYIGYGQTRPKTTNDNEDNKRKNRRVEFVISQ